MASRQSTSRITDFFHKASHWEYWPLWLLYIPYFIWTCVYALRCGTFGFMTAVNPSMENSGFFNDSKMETLKLFPPAYIPITLYGTAETRIAEILSEIETKAISYPLILKPDIGERGTEVKKVLTEAELLAELSLIEFPYQIQEFIGYGTELGVFWYRYPDEPQGQVTSLTLKKYLSVTGDGRSTIKELIMADARARFQLEKLESQGKLNFNDVLKAEEELILNEIGNHARGTTFINGNAQIDDRLTDAMNDMMSQTKGIYFGRADIKCESLESFKNLENFKLLEFNGVKAEPTHIYEPGYPLLKGLRELIGNIDIIYRIALQNKARGITFKKGAFWDFWDYTRNRIK